MTRSPRPLGLLLLSVFVAMTVALVVAAVKSRGPDRESTATPFAEARDGVCEALEEARSGRSVAARRAFVNRSHRPLHNLAAAAAGRDREVAARLLEAKQRVERDFEDGEGSLSADLDELGAAADGAIAVVGGRSRGACGAEEN